MDRAIGQKATLDPSGYNLTFPNSDTYYNNYSTDNDPKTYFALTPTNEYAIKTSLYAGNIPISRDPAYFTGMSENKDRLEVSVNNLELVIDTFTVSSLTQRFFLSKPELVVNWNDLTTGDVMSFGYYPPSGVSTAPNIIVRLNGIAISYGVSWTITFGRMRELIILDPISLTDIITVEYLIFPGSASLETAPPLPQILHTINITLLDSDINTIKLGNRYILDLPTSNIPCVSWYSSITSEFISSSSIPTQYQPLALFEEAEPNITITLNGITINYKLDWTFLLRLESSVLKPAIAFSENQSLSLSSGDVLQIDYFSTT